MWPHLGKLTILAQNQAQVKYILLLHIIDTLMHTLSKHSNKITRDGQVCFSTQFFLGHAKHWEVNTDGVWHLGALIGWHGSRSSPRHWLHLLLWYLTGVVTCLAYAWLELKTFLGVFFPTAATTHPHHLSPITYLSTSDITAMPVKASQNQVGQTISVD